MTAPALPHTDVDFECPECGSLHLASFHKPPDAPHWERMCRAHRENAERWEARARAAEAFVPVASTSDMRNRLRELASPPRDDFDRAVLIVLDDFDRLYAAHREMMCWSRLFTGATKCPSCHCEFKNGVKNGDTCRFGGCPMGGDFR